VQSSTHGESEHLITTNAFSLNVGNVLISSVLTMLWASSRITTAPWISTPCIWRVCEAKMK